MRLSNLMSDLVSTKRSSIPIGWEAEFRWKAAVAANLGRKENFSAGFETAGHYSVPQTAYGNRFQATALGNCCAVCGLASNGGDLNGLGNPCLC